MPTWINGSGSGSAKLMLVSECPSKFEDESGIPLSGQGNELVNEMLEEAGIKRDACYNTNIYKIRPPEGELRRVAEVGYTPDYFLSVLHKEINTIKPNCILALGELALKTLT